MLEAAQEINEIEKTQERKAVVLGRLGDLGLGNPDGIPSTLQDASDTGLQEVADRDNEALVDPTDVDCTACIDGRRCISNADGSAAKVRLRRVGGSASNLGVALNSEASITKAFGVESTLGEDIKLVDELIGYRSAHLGGCGGANGEVDDNKAIANQPAIIEAVKTLFSVPEVTEYLKLDTIRQEIGDEEFEAAFSVVVANAAKTADFLIEKGWDGKRYVEGVKASNPENVEDLEVDETDAKFHGHREPKLSIIIGDKTSPLSDDGFTWNLKATKNVAEALAGQSGSRGYLLALIADAAKHMAVASRLPSDKTPVILQVA